VLLIAAEGSAFCAGADLNAMLALGRGERAANVADAERLAKLLLALRDCPKPSIAVVQGPAFGGGMGLAAACDIALGSTGARFRLPEVQLGLVPAVISPYVLEAIGLRQARRYFLSGEPLDAGRARELGLLHAVVGAAELEAEALRLAREVALGGPHALAECKRLIADVAHHGPGAGLAGVTAEWLATLRAGREAQEGVGAALGRRPPAWRAS
jgi:methylglutaconyl-CoA hydratase